MKHYKYCADILQTSELNSNDLYIIKQGNSVPY